MDLSLNIYKLTKSFPSDERFGIIAHMRRSGVSVASNIAEGAGRNTDGEFIHFLGMAEGSANELQTQALISKRLEFLPEKDFYMIESSVKEIKNMLFSLKKSLGSKS